jgi:hypothetical protein
VLVTLIGYDRVTGVAVPTRRVFGAAVALAGVATLAVAAGGIVTVLGVVLLALTGISWGLLIPIRTAAGAAALLGEPLSAALFVAAGLVAAGMWPARPPSPAAPQRG